MEGIKHQQGMFKFFRRQRSQFFIIKQLYQCSDVITAVHVTQQFNRFFFINKGTTVFAFRNGTQKTGLNVSRFIHARRNTLRNEF